MATQQLPEPPDEHLFNQLLLQANEAGFGMESLAKGPEKNPGHVVLPTPGFCLKTKDGNGKKVFVNICHGDNLPAPKDMSDEELLKLLDSDDPSGFRIPMSIGEPHVEMDKGGEGCTAYDIVVNPKFFSSVKERQILMGFFLTVVLEGLEHKYNLELNRDWKLLKNKKFFGTLQEQNIRSKSKPWIMEMNENSSSKPSGSPLISEISSTSSQEKQKVVKAPEPGYTILQEPSFGYPEFLVAEIHLPKVKIASTVTLDLGEDRILLQTRSNIYHLDIYLPFNIDQEQCGSQFNRKTKILTITMPVQPES